MCTKQPKAPPPPPPPPPPVQEAIAPDQMKKRNKSAAEIGMAGSPTGSMLTGDRGIATSSLNIGTSSLLGGGTK